MLKELQEDRDKARLMAENYLTKAKIYPTLRSQFTRAADSLQFLVAEIDDEIERLEHEK